MADKIAVVEALLGKVSALLVGGAMANTFLAATGKDMKKSLVEGDKLALARTTLIARDRGVALVLPVDAVVADSIDAPKGETCAVDAIPGGRDDARHRSENRRFFAKRFARQKDLERPMVLFEKAPFSG